VNYNLYWVRKVKTKYLCYVVPRHQTVCIKLFLSDIFIMIRKLNSDGQQYQQLKVREN
jgi:hypothetical protein